MVILSFPLEILCKTLHFIRLGAYTYTHTVASINLINNPQTDIQNYFFLILQIWAVKQSEFYF